MDALDDHLRSGRIPPAETLEGWVAAEWPRVLAAAGGPADPDVVRLAVALALLGDPHRWGKLVVHDYFRQKFSYRQQKEGGMSAEDLAPEPSEYVSDRRIRAAVESYLTHRVAGVPAGVADAIRQRLAGFPRAKP